MLSKRRFESYQRAEVVAQAARRFMTARVAERDERFLDLTAAVLDWMTVTGKQKYATPVRRGRHRQKSPDAVEALEELLAAWPADSLPPHALCMKAANAINKFKH